MKRSILFDIETVFHQGAATIKDDEFRILRWDPRAGEEPLTEQFPYREYTMLLYLEGGFVFLTITTDFKCTEDQPAIDAIADVVQCSFPVSSFSFMY